MPIVVSVPKCIKCLVVGETSVTLVAVGLFDVEKPEYFVKWENYDSDQNTWEPIENLENCQNMIN